MLGARERTGVARGKPFGRLRVDSQYVTPRILVTRSAHKASTLAVALRSLGAEPILIPTVALAPPTSFRQLDAALAELASFHWLLFTSANAVEAFALRAGRTAPHRLSSPGLRTAPARQAPQRIAAVGPATAAALRAIGLEPTVVPATATAECLGDCLLAEALQDDGSPTRMLLLRAEQARDELPNALRSAGADLTIAPVYRNLVPRESIPLLQSIFASPEAWPDAITFTSSSTATHLLTLLEAADLVLPADPRPDDRPLRKMILRASIGPVTSATLRALGYPPHLESPEANIRSLVHTLADALHLHPPVAAGSLSSP